MHRTAILVVVPLLALLAAPPAAAQVARGGFVSYAADGGGTALAEGRFAWHVGYTVEETSQGGLHIGARYLVGMHLLRANPEAYRERYGEGTLEGGGGSLTDTGADVEVGVKLGPLRPYAFTGYHYYRQSSDAATITRGADTVEVPFRRHQGFSRASGYGAVLLLTGSSGVFAERFRGGGGGGEDGVMRAAGTRFGLRYAW